MNGRSRSAHNDRARRPSSSSITPVSVAKWMPSSAIARGIGLAVVEDNAHGLYGKYHGQYPRDVRGAGRIEFSRDEKLYLRRRRGSCSSRTQTLIQRAEIIREKGTDRSRFFRGEVDKYNWVDVGSSYLPSDLLAAFLRAQLEHRDQIQAARRDVWETTFASSAIGRWRTGCAFRLCRRNANRVITCFS